MQVLVSIILLSLTLARCGAGSPIDSSSSPTSTGNSSSKRPIATGTNSDVKVQEAVTTQGETSLDLTQCGFPTMTVSIPLQSQHFTMDPTAINAPVPILGGIFQSNKLVNISGSFATESGLEHQLISYKSTPDMTTSSTDVASFIANSTGSGDATILNPVDRARIGEKNPEWAGVFCTLQPAMRVEHNDNKHVATEFSQPIPFGLLTVGDATRIKAELKTKRSWTKISAKIVESTQPALAVGTVLQGTVTMDPVVPDAAHATADIAIRVTYNFGGPDKNKLMGLPVSFIWYVDSANHKVTAVQVDSTGSKLVNFK